VQGTSFHNHLPLIDEGTQTNDSCSRPHVIDVGTQHQPPDSELRQILNKGEARVLHALRYMHDNGQGATELLVVHNRILLLGNSNTRNHTHLVKRIAVRMELEIVETMGTRSRSGKQLKNDTVSLRLPVITPDVDSVPSTAEAQHHQPDGASTAPTLSDLIQLGGMPEEALPPTPPSETQMSDHTPPSETQMSDHAPPSETQMSDHTPPSETQMSDHTPPSETQMSDHTPPTQGERPRSCAPTFAASPRTNEAADHMQLGDGSALHPTTAHAERPTLVYPIVEAQPSQPHASCTAPTDDDDGNMELDEWLAFPPTTAQAESPRSGAATSTASRTNEATDHMQLDDGAWDSAAWDASCRQIGLQQSASEAASPASPSADSQHSPRSGGSSTQTSPHAGEDTEVNQWHTTCTVPCQEALYKLQEIAAGIPETCRGTRLGQRLVKELEPLLQTLLDTVWSLQASVPVGGYRGEKVTLSKRMVTALLNVAAPTVNTDLRSVATAEAKRCREQVDPLNVSEHEERLLAGVAAYFMVFVRRISLPERALRAEVPRLVELRTVVMASVCINTINNNANQFQKALGIRMITGGNQGLLSLGSSFGVTCGNTTVQTFLESVNKPKPESWFGAVPGELNLEMYFIMVDNLEFKIFVTFHKSGHRNKVVHTVTCSLAQATRPGPGFSKLPREHGDPVFITDFNPSQVDFGRFYLGCERVFGPSLDAFVSVGWRYLLDMVTSDGYQSATLITAVKANYPTPMKRTAERHPQRQEILVPAVECANETQGLQNALPFFEEQAKLTVGTDAESKDARIARLRSKMMEEKVIKAAEQALEADAEKNGLRPYTSLSPAEKRTRQSEVLKRLHRDDFKTEDVRIKHLGNAWLDRQGYLSRFLVAVNTIRASYGAPAVSMDELITRKGFTCKEAVQALIHLGGAYPYRTTTPEDTVILGAIDRYKKISAGIDTAVDDAAVQTEWERERAQLHPAELKRLGTIRRLMPVNKQFDGNPDHREAWLSTQNMWEIRMSDRPFRGCSNDEDEKQWRELTVLPEPVAASLAVLMETHSQMCSGVDVPQSVYASLECSLRDMREGCGTESGWKGCQPDTQERWENACKIAEDSIRYCTSTWGVEQYMCVPSDDVKLEVSMHTADADTAAGASASPLRVKVCVIPKT